MRIAGSNYSSNPNAYKTNQAAPSDKVNKVFVPKIHAPSLSSQQSVSQAVGRNIDVIA